MDMDVPVKPQQDSAHSDGTIAACPHNGCGYRCCEFQQGNYIVLFPDELETAVAQGQSVAHLKITAAYNGGFKAICTAAETATCDHGYKPLDCKSYPYFPIVRDGKIQAGLKGKKCPLVPELLPGHADFVERSWRAAAEQFPGVVAWLNEVQLVGYESVAGPPNPEQE
jgi:Fe-S-cluster containining protein